MPASSAPSISITPTGQEPAADVTRIIQRVGRLKTALANPEVNAAKRSLLQSELDKHLVKIAPLRDALEGL